MDVLSDNELPMGLSMALARNTEALDRFASMTPEQQQRIIDRTHTVESKAEMQQLVRQIAHGEL